MESELCPICDRELGAIQIQDHHLIPKMYKGKVTIRLHRICHQKIHATFSEVELNQYYHTVDRIREHEQITKFVKWVKTKPPEYYDKNDDTQNRRRQRRR